MQSRHRLLDRRWGFETEHEQEHWKGVPPIVATIVMGRGSQAGPERGNRGVKVEMSNAGWISSSAAVWRQGEDPERRLRFPVPCI